MPTVAITIPTTFGASTSGTTTQLDNNFTTGANALNNFNQYNNYLVDSGPANSLAVSIPVGTTGTLTAGLCIQVKCNANNSGASVLNFNALGNANVKNFDGTNLSATQIVANAVQQFQYDGTNWILQTPRTAVVATNITLGTPTATTSGSTIDYTGLPAGVKRFTFSFSGVSLSGTDNLLLQIGDSGGIEATGYLGCASTAAGQSNSTTGVLVQVSGASALMHGSIVATLVDSTNNIWAFSGNVGSSASAFVNSIAFTKALSPGPLDRVRLTVTGVNTFDAGSVNIAYES